MKIAYIMQSRNHFNGLGWCAIWCLSRFSSFHQIFANLCEQYYYGGNKNCRQTGAATKTIASKGWNKDEVEEEEDIDEREHAENRIATEKEKFTAYSKHSDKAISIIMHSHNIFHYIFLRAKWRKKKWRAKEIKTCTINTCTAKPKGKKKINVAPAK